MYATAWLPKYKIYFPITCINVSTLVVNTLFSSSKAVMRSCKGRVGSGALVVKSGGSWAARSAKKLCFMARESSQSRLHCKLSLFSYLSTTESGFPSIRASTLLNKRCFLIWVRSILPMCGKDGCGLLFFIF